MTRRSRRAPRPIEIEASDSFAELTIHLGLGPSHNIPAGDEHHIEALPATGSQTSKALSQEAFSTVAHHRSPELSSRGNAQPVLGLSILKGDHHELRAFETPPLPENPIEFRLGTQPASVLELQAHAP